MNIAIILAEVSLVVLVFLLVNWLFNKFSKRLTKVSMLRNEERNIKTVRRSITKVLLLLCLVLCILIVGLNGFLIYRGENLQQYTLGLIYRVPPQFWISLGIGILQSIGTLIVAGIVIKVVHSVLNIASMLLRTLTKVNPGKHLQIQRVLRKVLMSTFIQEGIATTARAGG